MFIVSWNGVIVWQFTWKYCKLQIKETNMISEVLYHNEAESSM